MWIGQVFDMFLPFAKKKKKVFIISARPMIFTPSCDSPTPIPTTSSLTSLVSSQEFGVFLVI